MLKKLVKGAQKLVGDILPGDSEKYLGTVVGLATGNPLLAAGAGYLGGGTSGAIGGALAGYTSPGIGSLAGRFSGAPGTFLGGLTGASKVGLGATSVGDFFLGRAAEGANPATRGIFGAGNQFGAGIVDGAVKEGAMPFLQKAALTGLGTLTLADSLEEDDPNETITTPDIVTTDDTLGGDSQFAYSTPEIIFPSPPQKRGELTFDYGNIPFYAAVGGTPEFPRENGIGAIEGPGTETSDSIPAMLSDGEFVMNARAVKGAGYAAGAKDDFEARKLGAKKMYETMDKLEAVA